LTFLTALRRRMVWRLPLTRARARSSAKPMPDTLILRGFAWGASNCSAASGR